MPNEADTCRQYVAPKLQAAGWDVLPYQLSEQVIFTDGRIVVQGDKAHRREGKKADYLLRYRPDFTLAVVEAKASYKSAADGVQQTKDYAQVLGLKFAYATNGKTIIEVDFLTGIEREVETFPGPEDLWARLSTAQSVTPQAATHLLAPVYTQNGLGRRYYQQIAINRAVQAIAGGNKRVLLTMATGTGKTAVAFQICWKLWTSKWNRTAGAETRPPRILYLADRNILIDDPKDKTFAPFGDARWKIENGEAVKSREMYFAIYQAIAKDERRPGLYREYPPGFFDLIVVDECHRGSAREESNWREILEYFQPAFQLGMTATPLRDDNRDTYAYFGDPVYTYSLRQGIEDGFLAPYVVHRVVTTYDAAGWRPTEGDLDRFGRAIPDELYATPDFERIVSLRARTEAVARHLTDFLRRADPYAKTIVFCVDQEHASEMRGALARLNPDLMQAHTDWVCRVTSDEGAVGVGHLSRFQDVESQTPAVVTTSQMLTTGVDVPTCRNVVLLRVINSMTEFKQTIGRGTRVREDYDKLFFTILDYTGSATKLFADPDFDGDPVVVTCVPIDDDGKPTGETVIETPEVPEPPQDDGPVQPPIDTGDKPPRKYYFDGGHVEIAADVAYYLDAEGRKLRVVKLTDYTAEQVRALYTDAGELRTSWADPVSRLTVVHALMDRGLDIAALAEAAGQPDADPFDLLCHIAFSAPISTRRQRAQRMRTKNKAFFDQYGPEARAVLDALLEKYADHGVGQLVMPDSLEVPPVNQHGNIPQIVGFFGGEERLVGAVRKMQELLYAA